MMDRGINGAVLAMLGSHFTYWIFTPAAIEKHRTNKQRFLIALYPDEQQVFLMGSYPNLILRDRTPNNHN